MTTHVFLQKFNLGVLVSTCFTLKMLFTTVWRLWILFIWSWILILILILFLHVLQDAFVWFFSTVCFQMLSPIVCLHTYNHTCCIVTRWNGFSPECFLCDLSNRYRKSYICHTNYRRNVLKSFFHFRHLDEESINEESFRPMRESSRKDRVECTQCGKSYSNQANYVRHERAKRTRTEEDQQPPRSRRTRLGN